MDNENSKRRMPKALKWVFGVSVALNLLFVGAFAGAALRHAGDGPDKRGHREIGQNYGTPFVRALPREARRELRQRMRGSGKGNLPTREERRTIYREVAGMLRAETFDASGALALFAQQGQTVQRAQAKAQDVWLELVTQMTVAERRTVADRLEDQMARRDAKTPGRTR